MPIFEVGFPKRKLCNDTKEFLKLINLNNGLKKSIYRTLYNFERMNGDKPDYNSAIINKIFWDFDNEGSWEETNKLHKEFNKEKLRHRINMSGGGYHMFLFCKEYTPKYSKSCLYNIQKYYINKLNLKCDEAIVGDVARLYRIENTYNVKRGRFCIPLKESDFDKGDNFCKSLAMKQQFIKSAGFMGGDKLISLKEYDTQTEQEKGIHIENLDGISSDSIVIKNVPPCIGNILNNKNMNYKQRYLLILYLKERGYTKKEIYNILKQHLSEKKLKHCILDEKQLQYLYEDRDDLVFPKCESIKKSGFCIEGCQENINRNIYKV